MQMLTRGVLIACEGIDGSGKSTLVSNVTQKLLDQKLPVIATREPGATPLGTILRAIVQEKKVPMCPKAEYLLFASDRAQHFHELVMPNLNARKIVLSDRMCDSSLVYQGFGRGTSRDAIQYINEWTMDSIKPDITLYIQIDARAAHERIIARNEQLTSYEKEKEAFFDKLVVGFETLYANRSDVIRLDGLNTPDQLTQAATEAIICWLRTHGCIYE